MDAKASAFNPLVALLLALSGIVCDSLSASEIAVADSTMLLGAVLWLM